jgi:uncharacterized protein YceK
MKLRIIVLAVATASLLAGCGDGGKPAASQSAAGANKAAPNQEQVTLMRELSKCYREHGVPNYPDPVQGPDGTWALVGNVAEPPKTALDACSSIAGRIPPDQSAPPASAAEMTKLRKFAQCMRQKGLSDFPDPEADGSFQLPARLQTKQAIATQRKACAEFNPNGLNIRTRTTE